jgi:hypothetical protein
MKKILFLVVFFPALVFTSCSDDKEDNRIKISKTEYLLNFEDEVQIEATSINDITYTTASEYVAKVSSSGLITAGRVGETYILLENGNDERVVQITVKPRYDLYPEPIKKIMFGLNKQQVKEAFGNPSYETTTGMIFENYYSFYDYVFLFDSKGIMTSMSVTMETLQAPNTLTNFLTERYQLFSLQGYTASFIDERKNMLVGMLPSDDLSNIFIMYMAYTGSRSIDSSSIYINELNKLLESSK